MEKTIKEININFYKVFASIFYPLKKSYILDFGFFIYIMKNRNRLFKYKPVFQRDRLKCKGSRITIQDYKDLDIQFINQRKKKSKILQLFRMVYYSDFPFNIVSFQRLEERGIDWFYRYRIFTTSGDIEPLGYIRKIYR